MGAGLSFGLGRIMTGLGRNMDQNYLNQQELELQKQQMELQQQAAQEKKKADEQQYNLNQLLYNAYKKNPDALLPTPVQEALQKAKDRSAKVQFGLNQALGDPPNAAKWLSYARAMKAGDDKYAESIAASMTSKPPTQKMGTVFNKTTMQWENRAETPGPLGPNIEPAEARYKELGTKNKQQELFNTPVGELPANMFVVTPDGKGWPDPTTTYGDALRAGGSEVSAKGKDTLLQMDAADAGLNDLLQAGQRVLPGGSGGVANALNPLKMRAETALGDPDVGDYNATKIALINHLRAIAGVARVNQQELAQVNDALANANSVPALQAAIAQARKALNRARPSVIRVGKLVDTGTVKTTSSNDRAIGWAPDGRQVFQRPDGTKYAK